MSDSAGREGGGVRKSAPYGRACTNCARAKCRCILLSNGGICERCIRLKKECTPSSSIRTKLSQQGSSQATRLEQKLDGLVSLLKAGNNTLRSSDISWSSEASSSASPSTGELGTRNDQLDITNDRPAHQLRPTNNEQIQAQVIGPLTPVPAPTLPLTSGYSLPTGCEPSPEQAERYLNIYRATYLPFFPFVHFDDNMTSKRLRQEMPFLWMCIMAVSSTDPTQQNSIGQAVRETAARKVVVEGERTMDLLLGLLCFVGWGHFRFCMGPLLTVFSHLCATLTLDLELQKHRSGDGPMKYLFPRYMPSVFHGKIRIPAARSIEHRRTVLACYFVTSSAACFHSKVEPLPWSSYLDQCLKALEDTQEAPSDKILVHLIKLQRITSKATSVHTQIGDVGKEEGTGLISLYISSLSGQLAALKSQIPADLSANKILQATTIHTEITIKELILLRLPQVPLSTDPNLQSMDTLFSCLHAIKSWLDVVLTIEAADFIGFPFFLWKQFRTIVLMLIRLSSLDDPGWDVNLVRQTVDLPAVLDQMAENLEQLPDLTGSGENVRLMKGLKAWYMAVHQGRQSSPDQADPMSTESVDGLQKSHGADLGDQQGLSFPGMDIFSFDEDIWGGDLFGWWPQ